MAITYEERVKAAMAKAAAAVAAGATIKGTTPDKPVVGAAGGIAAGVKTAITQPTTTPKVAIGGATAGLPAASSHPGVAGGVVAGTANTPQRTPVVNAQPKPVPIAVPVNAPPPPATNGNDTAKKYIEELSNARRAQTLAQLEKSRQEALLNLQGEKSAIAPVYYDKRNQVAAGSQQQARNFAEFMAARGGTSSGANAQAELSRNMVTQGNLGTLGRQEAAAFQDIERRTTGVNNSYASDKAAAEAGIQGEQLNLMLTDYYRAQERGDRLTQLAIENEFQRAGLTGYLNGQRTLQGQGFDWGRTMDEAGLTGMYNGQKTAEQAAREWQQRFNYGQAIGQFNNGQKTIEMQQIEEDRKRYGDEWAYQKVRDQIADERWKMEYDEDVRRYGLNYALDQYQAKTSRQSSNNSADNASFNKLMDVWKATGKAPAGLEGYGISQGTAYGETSANGMNEKMMEESRGMVDAIRSGQITPQSAYTQIEQDTKLGFYTAEEAEVLKSMLREISPSAPQQPVTEQQQEAIRSNPSDKEIDAEAKKLGYPTLDYRSWYKDPKGKTSGVDFATWQTLYGPRLVARK